MELCWKPSAFHGQAASRALQAGGRSERRRRRTSSRAWPPWPRRFFVLSFQNDETYTEGKEETNPKENVLTKMGIPSKLQNGQPPHRGLLPPFIPQGGREIQRGIGIPPFTPIRPLSYELVHPSNAARPPFSPGFCS